MEKQLFPYSRATFQLWVYKTYCGEVITPVSQLFFRNPGKRNKGLNMDTFKVHDYFEQQRVNFGF